MLVSSSQALDMLSVHAPRAWAKRLLSWQIYVGELELLFAAGTWRERMYAFHFTRGENVLDPTTGVLRAGPDRSIEDIRSEFGDEIANAVQKAGANDMIDVRIETWHREPRTFPVEVLVHSEEVDWESGTITADFSGRFIESTSEESGLWTENEGADLTLNLLDMCFDLSDIEMIAPGASPPATVFLPRVTGAGSEAATRKGGPGRRREYDWDGALLHLVGQAEKNSIAPDPDAVGAQAAIKRILADWFSEHGGKIPADSQLQSFAKRALDAIRAAVP
jgi:hypothetical protein